MFYPADARQLTSDIDAMLAAATGESEHSPPGAARHQSAASQKSSGYPKALIVPHAGYIYSGSVAASAYARLRPARNRIRTVVLLGPVHRMPVRGLALPGADAFETPLGRVEIDASAVARIRHLPQVTESVAAHRLEHALEVHLPFLQRTLEDFRLVPLAVGHASREEVAEVLELLWGGDETLIVVSSDLSHYLPYEQARILDAETAAMIVDLRSDIVHERACGGTPINGLTLAAHRRGLQIELVDLRNSGDTAGSKDRVVGYAAFLVGAPSSAGAGATEFAGSHHNTGKELIRIARHAIEEKLGGSVCVPAMAAWLHRPAATFVTLTRQGVLRGCIDIACRPK
jgi:AmmeMemoRadiSam system protein B